MTPSRTPIPSSPRVMVPTLVHQSIPRVQTLPSDLPVASRTRVAQAAAKKFSKDSISNIRSKSHNALERALHAVNFLDSKCVNAKRLASQKFLLAIITMALAVMNIDSREMLKH